MPSVPRTHPIVGVACSRTPVPFGFTVCFRAGRDRQRARADCDLGVCVVHLFDLIHPRIRSSGYLGRGQAVLETWAQGLEPGRRRIVSDYPQCARLSVGGSVPGPLHFHDTAVVIAGRSRALNRRTTAVMARAFVTHSLARSRARCEGLSALAGSPACRPRSTGRLGPCEPDMASSDPKPPVQTVRPARRTGCLLP